MEVTCCNCGKVFDKEANQVRWYTKHFCSRQCRYAGQVGEGNPNWVDGQGYARNRKSANERGARHKAWAAAVKERDGHRCTVCSGTKGLSAHHHEDWRSSPEKRYELSNGVTLCQSCHMKEHSSRGWFVHVTATR